MNSHGRWRPGHLAGIAALAILLGISFWMWFQMRSQAQTAFEDEALRQVTAAAISPALIDAWSADDQLGDLRAEGDFQQQLMGLALVTGAEITALSTGGEFITQTHHNDSTGSAAGDDWSRLPEVRAALFGSDGTATRPLEAGGRSYYMVARLVRDQGAPVGLLHLAFPRDTLVDYLDQLNRILALNTLVAMLLAVLLVVILTAYHDRNVHRITTVVDRLLAGDLEARVMGVSHAELGLLGRTVNRWADQYQRQMKKRAREKGRLNTVMRAMTDGLIILNRNGLVKLINPVATRMLGTTVEKTMNRSFVQAVRDHRIAEVWQQCQRSGVEESAAIELGVTQFMRVVVTPFVGRAGRGYLVLLQDMTQMRRLQTMRQDFISNVSHELRTPLASLRALAETLRDSALDDPPAAAHFLDRMEIEVDALTQMVEELLELSRIESGQVPLRLNPVLPHVAILPAVERLSAQAERGQVTLEVRVPRDMPLVLVDAGRIHQVVTNLVHNAIKFTPPGGTITVDATANSSEVTVSVTDTGFGIATQDLQRIFERFYKTDRSRAVGGTGLGLAIAKHIVQAHKGRIWATSYEGKGSTFYFTMPREEPDAEPQVIAGEAIDSVATTVNAEPNRCDHGVVE